LLLILKHLSGRQSSGLSSDWETLDGLIDEVDVFNRALTAEEVYAIYAAGSAGKWKPPTWPEVAVGSLLADVAELGLQEAIANSLTKKLDAALKALSDSNQNNEVAAVNSLNAFINLVEAQRGKKIEEADADVLMDRAAGIIEALVGD